MEALCARCGSGFIPRRAGRPQRFCSADCRQNPRQPRPCTIPCIQCGIEFQPAAPSGRLSMYCGQRCRSKAGNTRRRRALPPLAQPTDKACAYCGRTFVAKSRDRIYCYDGWCGQRAYHERRITGERRVGQRLATCNGCGAEFSTVRPEARWCSKKCANRHWGNVRARQRARPSTARYVDLQIFERDGWRCHLCKKRVRKDLPRVHPDGATIDHLVPTARGGLDEPANVATAHWKCNRDKGTRAMNEQLAVF